MEKAKAAVGNFLSKDGKHDTTVHETVNPAVQQEKVTPTRHENSQTVIDREVHQDHHHTSVQPIKDREVLPEQHTHQMAGVEHRQFKHGNDDHVKGRLAAEQSQFKNTREVGSTQHTQSTGATVTGEHVHHHVHENIQPVIHKETIQPSVVHSTVPVHEIHQNEAKHHTATSLPAVTMDEFNRQGGSLSGREERTDSFGGEPRAIGGTIGGAGAKGTTSLTEDGNTHFGHQNGSHQGKTRTDATGTSGVHPSSHAGTTGSGIGAHSTTSHSSVPQGKPSLMDKINPKKDADGDGKAGFMK